MLPWILFFRVAPDLKKGTHIWHPRTKKRVALDFPKSRAPWIQGEKKSVPAIIILTLILASLTLLRYISYYGPWFSWSYLFLFRRSLLASKRAYTDPSDGAVRADDPAERTWRQCLRAVVWARYWANCLWQFDLVQIPRTICLKSATPR